MSVWLAYTDQSPSENDPVVATFGDPLGVAGFLPDIFDQSDHRPAREQADDRYGFAGGWRPISGFTFRKNDGAILYPGDPPLLPVAYTGLPFTKELLVLYPAGFIAKFIISEQDASGYDLRLGVEVVRMD